MIENKHNINININDYNKFVPLNKSSQFDQCLSNCIATVDESICRNKTFKG